jgi:hypothetical protein
MAAIHGSFSASESDTFSVKPRRVVVVSEALWSFIEAQTTQLLYFNPSAWYQFIITYFSASFAVVLGLFRRFIRFTPDRQYPTELAA